MVGLAGELGGHEDLDREDFFPDLEPSFRVLCKTFDLLPLLASFFSLSLVEVSRLNFGAFGFNLSIDTIFLYIFLSSLRNDLLFFLISLLILFRAFSALSNELISLSRSSLISIVVFRAISGIRAWVGPEGNFRLINNIRPWLLYVNKFYFSRIRELRIISFDLNCSIST